jgi:hypothetical protein
MVDDTARIYIGQGFERQPPAFFFLLGGRWWILDHHSEQEARDQCFNERSCRRTAT